jgi:hypothetical protein
MVGNRGDGSQNVLHAAVRESQCAQEQRANQNPNYSE